MDSNITHEDLPKGYMEKRKKATLIVVVAIYIFCIFQLLKAFGIISVNKGSVLYLIQYGIVLLSVAAIIHSDTVKKFYNSIPMINCNEVKVFSKKQSFLMMLPVIIAIPFILIPFILYSLVVVMTLAAMVSFNKTNYTGNKHIRSKW